MKFSITIPTYKSRYLKEAIESVISQTYTDWELIIVDDCSPEDLPSIVQPFLTDSRIRFYRNEKNCGAVNVVDNWNICLGYCTGDYVICMGDDDRLLPDCLTEYKALIEKYPELNVYHGQTEIIDEKGKVTEYLEKRPEWEDALSLMTRRWNVNKLNKQYIGDFCFRKLHLVSLGGYYTLPFAWGSDDVTAFRATLAAGIANTKKEVFQYRENSLSISLSHHDEEKAFAIISQQKWYHQTFQELLSQSHYSKESIFAAQRLMTHFTDSLISYHIQNDLKEKGLKRYFYWWKQFHRNELSQYQLLKSFIATIIKKS